MSILRAVMNIDPTSARGGGDVIIIDDSAVVPQEGPAGAGADVVYPKNSTISIYVVREGDTVSEIAEMFDVSVNTIMWANDITRSTALKVGEQLVILPITGVRHVVKKGDTLETLAKKYQADAEEIAQYNEIEGQLAIGAEVTIPNGEIAVTAPPRPATTVKKGSSGSASYTYSGYYLRPITGGTRTQGIHGYNGVDLAAPVGTPILAAASGEVIISRQGGWNGGYGNYVVIKHDNGTQTLYAHNSSNAVGMGQYVVKGQIIGYVGSTGRSTGAHVHFEIRGGPRNPF
jgi:murein DD-endopeptidase MepM/ murein hydrolase activator NlpD